MLASRRIDLVGHNLANVNTVGFKAQRLVNRQQEFSDTLAAALPNNPERSADDLAQTPGVVHVATVTDFSQGPISYTGDPLHVALAEKNQFFAVQSSQGVAYTKAGNFTLNSEGALVTADGVPVLGEGGPIVLTGSRAQIAGNGSVFSDGNLVGKLKVVESDDLSSFERMEGTRFKVRAGGKQPADVDSVQVITGSLEMANVQVVDSMVDMINAQKTFESYAKTVQTIGELNDTALRTPRSVG